MDDFLFFGSSEDTGEYGYPEDFDPTPDAQPTDEEIDAMADAAYELADLEHAAQHYADMMDFDYEG